MTARSVGPALGAAELLRDHRLRHPDVLLESLAAGGVLRAAEHVLQTCAGEVLPEAASAAVLALAPAGHVERVRAWCDARTAQARRQGAVPARR